jgi:hypothetical protein
VPATYSLVDFKREVISWLSSPSNFGSAVTPGTKAVQIAAQGNRRSADVVLAAEFRRYTTNLQYHKGICFFLWNGMRIENFPKQHSQNCTAKHQATNSWFKKTVRVFKNMRNRMIDDGVITPGVAPSYFIEGLLYNVPNDKFGVSFDDTVVNAFNWIVNADQSKFVCANELQWLVRDGSPISWPTANCSQFLRGLGDFWSQWS